VPVRHEIIIGVFFWVERPRLPDVDSSLKASPKSKWQRFTLDGPTTIPYLEYRRWRSTVFFNLAIALACIAARIISNFSFRLWETWCRRNPGECFCKESTFVRVFWAITWATAQVVPTSLSGIWADSQNQCSVGSPTCFSGASWSPWCDRTPFRGAHSDLIGAFTRCFRGNSYLLGRHWQKCRR